MLREALGRTQSFAAAAPHVKRPPANHAFPSDVQVEVLHHLVHVRIGDDNVPAPGLTWLVEPSGLNGPRDFVMCGPEASHQLGDRRESARYVVAVGDLPDPLFREPELVGDGLER
jgi:hypothetical protein